MVGKCTPRRRSAPRSQQVLVTARRQRHGAALPTRCTVVGSQRHGMQISAAPAVRTCGRR